MEKLIIPKPNDFIYYYYYNTFISLANKPRLEISVNTIFYINFLNDKKQFNNLYHNNSCTICISCKLLSACETENTVYHTTMTRIRTLINQ